ncbi:MAG: TetR/AcrR family transcriptional regulator [Cyanobacteria bacterium J06649_11]
MKQYHHKNLYQVLISSTLELLKTQSIKELSLRQVARHAGVSHAAPYRHFENKAALLTVVSQSILTEFNDYLQDFVTQNNEQPAKQLNIMSVAYIRYALRHPTKYQLLFGHEGSEELNLLTQKGGPLKNCLRKNPNKTFQFLIDIVIAGQTQGIFKLVEANTAALGIWISLHGLAMLLIQDKIRLKDTETVALVTSMSNQIAGVKD